MLCRVAILSVLIAASDASAASLPEPSTSRPAGPPGPRVEQVIEIAPVWSGHPVGFSLLTAGQRQYVAFYDADRKLTVGARELDEPQFRLVRLPEQLGWDSHNYVTLAVDRLGHLHLCGNMHGDPLVYFRTARPHDISTFARVPTMVGDREQRCTYPKFMRDRGGRLIFTYRDGGSGNGDQIFNVYDADTKQWRRLVDGPLLSGEGRMNAYPHGPVTGPDGRFHLCWVWRDTPAAETNHDLSYARSPDLLRWEDSFGRAIELPITIDKAEIVDPVPAGGGIINGNTKIGFDGQGRVILSYHKHDAAGHTQIYNARREASGWRIYQVTDWDRRWDFEGGGSIPFEIRLSAVRVEPNGTLSQSYRFAGSGGGRWRLDPQTLKPVARMREVPTLPAERRQTESPIEGMRPRTTGDAGKAPNPNVSFLLKWETLPPNRDRPRDEAPPPAMLRLYRLRGTGNDG